MQSLGVGAESTVLGNSTLEHSLSWTVVGATDQGRKRDHNEDIFLLRPDLGLHLVCDGMGGHQAGEVAAELAANAVADFFEACRRDPEGTWPFKPQAGQDDTSAMLGVAMKLANRRIRAAAEQDLGNPGMGTTCVAAHLAPAQTYVGWTGDSRGYLFRGGVLRPITEDHSLVGQLLRAGQITPEEAERHPHKNVITQALGPSELVKPDARQVDTIVGDVLLLCSDGLHGMVGDGDLARILASQPNLDAACQAMIDAANANGGVDNITVVLGRRHS